MGGIVTDCFITTFLCWAATIAIRPILFSRCGIDIGDYDDDCRRSLGGSPPSPRGVGSCLSSKYGMYFAQLMLWLLVITGARLLVSTSFFFGQDLLYDIYKEVFVILRLSDPASKMIFAVLIFPALGDAFQIVVQDCFLKKRRRRSTVEGYMTL